MSETIFSMPVFVLLSYLACSFLLASFGLTEFMEGNVETETEARFDGMFYLLSHEDKSLPIEGYWDRVCLEWSF
jgi:hypothetical protein